MVQKKDNIVEKKEDNIYTTNNFIYFHLIMMVTSFFLTMLLTNWGNPDPEMYALDGFGKNSTSTYLKIISSYIATLLFIWTVIAPRVLVSR